MTMEVTAHEVKDWDDMKNPGDFIYESAFAVQADGKDEPAGIVFLCPCGCGAHRAARFGGINHPTWTWNGDKEKPTLTPSLLSTTGCKWHGYLTEGVFRSC
jgi:hypothetical protein